VFAPVVFEWRPLRAGTQASSPGPSPVNLRHAEQMKKNPDMVRRLLRTHAHRVRVVVL
jgi:hypothetical protein